MLSPFSFPYIRMGKATTASSLGLKERNRDEWIIVLLLKPIHFNDNG